MRRVFLSCCVTIGLLAAATELPAEEGVMPRIDQRFAADTNEVPDFQKHVVPLFGRLGCNGRACHGSFQGQGGFRLSLFGYDFKSDHEALFDDDSPRVDTEASEDSLILIKPTDADMHDGGKRYDTQGWEYRVFRNWIEAGGKFESDEMRKLERLEVSPSEILFGDRDESQQLQVVAVWGDGQHEDVTPLCRFRTNDDQVARIDQQGRVESAEPGDTHVVVFYDNGVVPIPVIRPVSDRVGKNYPDVPTPTQVDRLVVNKLKKLGVVPSDNADDATFLRRLYLDLTGTLPAPAEVEAFLTDAAPDKRARKIDELLETPAYAAWWTTKLCDYTGNNDQNLNNVAPSRTRPSQMWYDWIHQRVDDNVPYDELVAGIVTATSRENGEDYRAYCEAMSQIYREDSTASYADRDNMPLYWHRRDFREIEARTIAFAYSFLGVRIQCAQCHKHPFDQWSKQDFADFQGFFSAVVANNRSRDRKEYDKIVEALKLDKEITGGQLRREFTKLLDEGKTVPFAEVYVNPARPRGRAANQRARGRQPAATARLLGGEEFDLTKIEDPREPLMQWLRSEDNPYFAKAFVNRVWSNYFNVGIVEPPDDLNLANPPSNKELLDYLAEQFVAHDFDMKWLHREICNSRTYQLSWQPNETNSLDKRNFSHSVPRRLPAEVAFDALQQATASRDRNAGMLSSMDSRAIAMATMPRNNNGPGFALSVFGRSLRESNCDCDRSSEPSLLQTVFLQNDSSVLTMIEDRRGWLSEVAPKPANTNVNALQTRQQQLTRAVERGTQLVARMKKQGNENALEKGKTQLARVRKQLKSVKEDLAAANAAAAAPVAETSELINEAYLRTLSRYPTEAELARSLTFIQESPEVASGLEGILWALINTKEFIVNK